MVKCVGLSSEEDVTERTGNAEQPSCGSWQSDAKKLSSDEDDSSTLNCISVGVFLSNLSSSHSSTAQAGNMWKGVRCATRTLQLAVEDALKKCFLRDVIDSARCICKKPRNLSVFVLLKKLKLKKPVLDIPARWNRHAACFNVFLLKDFCLDMAASNPNLHLLETSWNAFSMFVEVLKPAKIATKSLQYEQLTFGEFFGIWLNCKLKIAKLTSASSPLAQLLLSAMKKERQNS